MTSYVKKAKRVYRKAKKYGSKAMKIANKVNNNKYVKGAATLYSLGQKVAMLSHLVNIEKKRFDITVSSAVNIAQSAGVGVSGNYAVSVPPNPAEGVAQGQRIGLSIKAVSGLLSMQFTQQSATLNKLKLRWYLVNRPDNSALQTAPSSINQFFEPNPFSGVIDYYSNRDPEYFNAFKIMRTGTVNLAQDAITSGSSIVQIKVPIKCDLHQKFNTDASIATVKNNIMLFVVCSGGDTALNTGATLVFNMRWYYTDN